jgi:hypothetical protein
MVGEFAYNPQSVYEEQLFDLHREPDSMGYLLLTNDYFHDLLASNGSCSAVFWRDLVGMY